MHELGFTAEEKKNVENEAIVPPGRWAVVDCELQAASRKAQAAGPSGRLAVAG